MDADSANGPRVIAQDGKGLWRRAPWPVHDTLFELAAPEKRTVALVGDPADRDEVARELDLADERVVACDTLTRERLEWSAVVLFAQPPGKPLPAPAFAVLASRRILVVREPSVSFGLLAGIDHLASRTAAGAAELATAVSLHWDEFRSVRVFGRVAAEAHRATTVYARLAYDLAWSAA